MRNRKLLVTVLTIAMLFAFLTPSMKNAWVTQETSATPVHNINTGLNYTTIQAAIDDPQTLDGQTLMCDAGNYTENLKVYKSLTIIGAGAALTYIIPAEPNDTIDVNASVTISGFTITSTSGYYSVAARSFGEPSLFSRLNLTNNVFDGTGNGCFSSPTIGSDGTIYFEGNDYSCSGTGIINSPATSSNVTVYAQKNVFSCGGTGVLSTPAIGSDGTIYVESNVFNGTGSGIVLSGSNDNVISGNEIEGLLGNGIELTDSSQGNQVVGNTLNGNHYGIILLNGSDYNEIADNYVNSTTYDSIRLNWLGDNFAPVEFNNVTSNIVSYGYDGIFLDYPSSNNVVSSNFASDNNNDGIRLRQATNSIVDHNILTSNTYGIYAETSSNNCIYDNFLNNTNNAWDDGADWWNTTEQLGPNIIGGSYIGGNYWSDNPHNSESNGNGIGTVPYPIPGGSNMDYLPLIPVKPVPFTYSVTIYAYDLYYGSSTNVNIYVDNTLPQNTYATDGDNGVNIQLTGAPHTIWSQWADSDGDNFLWWDNQAPLFPLVVFGPGSHTAYYQSFTPICPIIPYNVTIKAYDSHVISPVDVLILGTGWSTDTIGHTFQCFGTCKFRVPWYDLGAPPTAPPPYNIGDLFEYWDYNSWLNAPCITVHPTSAPQVHTAYYNNGTGPYNVTIKAYDLGWNHVGYVIGVTITNCPSNYAYGVSCLTPQTYFNQYSYDYYTIASTDGLFTMGYGPDYFCSWNNTWPSTELHINQGGTYVAYYAPSLPVTDVAVVGITTLKTVVGQGYSQDITCMALSVNFPDTPLTVTLYANTIPIASETFGLLGGNSTSIDFVWDTTGVPYGNYTISACATPVPGETDTGDLNWTGGTVYVGIPGDVEGIGRVDMGNIVTILLAFGSTPGKPNWDQNCDIEGNNRVDMGDVVIALLHFGQHYP
jgi:parallel beta-helix repeat protein